MRVGCSFWKSLGAAVAALALNHTVAKAIINGFLTSDKPFFRTPKCEDKPALAAALLMVREEALMMVVMLLAAVAFYVHPQFQDTHSRLWVAVLLVQALPYLCAVILSFINVIPSLRSRPATPTVASQAQK